MRTRLAPTTLILTLPSLITLLALLILLFSGATQSHAQIVLPGLLSDHAVFQRDRPIHVWGTASPGATIAAHLHAQTATSNTDPRGHWSLFFAPERAGGPYTLTLTGDGQQVTRQDLLVGDVWFASGQSNMEFPLRGFTGAPLLHQAEEIAASTQPWLRLLRVEHRSSEFPLADVPATWTTCTPETAKDFSAVAYFFGRAIAADQNVPVGLIDSTWGGTPADSWVSMDTLGTDPRLQPAFASRAAFAHRETDLPAVLAAEKQEDDAARAAGQPVPVHPWHPEDSSWRPAGLFNGMIAPFLPMQLKGFLWYQGEANSDPARAPFYNTLLQALIGDWREQFAQGPLPFLYVQISSFESPGEAWGMLRDQQRRTLAVAGTSMAVSLDVGEAHNVHPANKQAVAERLVRAARASVYGEPVAYQGPTFRQTTQETASLRVWFDHGEELSYDGTDTSGFEVAGPDHRFVAATSRIEGSTVVVSASSVPDPMYVRFGWSSVVAHSLYNGAHLPASTFTSEPDPTR